VASSNPVLKLIDSLSIKTIPHCHVIWLALVARVADGPLSWRDLGLEASRLPKYAYIMFGRQEGAIDPNKLVLPKEHSQLVGQPWATNLVRVPLRTWILAALAGVAVDAIYQNDKDCIIITASANNLVRKAARNGLELVLVCSCPT
jgi:hypothetical protein